ncbi:MAG: hypothetical protein NTW21_40630 [Verrucomicrobia bacterium]|nr:hypothetical protein [Verrucomicrobiota bacterium]
MNFPTKTRIIRHHETALRLLMPCAAVVITFALPLPVAAEEGKQPVALDPPTVPVVAEFVFEEKCEKILEGKSGANRRGDLGEIRAADRLGEMAVAARFYQNGTYTDGAFNHNLFPVAQGLVRRSTDEEGWPAYRLLPPQHLATKFLGSRHMVCFRFDQRVPHIVYELDNGRLRKLLEVSAQRMPQDGFTALPELLASEVKRSWTLVFVPASTAVRQFTPVSADAEGGIVLETAEARIRQYNFRIKGVPFDTATGFPHGPASHPNIYGEARRFFSFVHPTKGLGTIWQDPQDQSIQLSWFSPDFKSPTQVRLQGEAREALTAAACDAAGMIYYFTVERGSGSTPRRASLSKADATGRLLVKKRLDTSAKGLDIRAFDRNSGCMTVAGGRLGLIFSRSMFNGHQGAIGLVYGTAGLDLLKHHGQTSGHSFDSVIQVDRRGNFLAMDLGDNYPRGLHLHRFDASQRQSQVIYTFKTRHADQPKRVGARTTPRYDEISGQGRTFYRWSNDNSTYTELGGIAECDGGIAVVFAGEVSPAGRALDNSLITSSHADPRNLGMVLVNHDFENVPQVKGRLIPPGMILSEGKSESGGFYDFGGGWRPQNNEGVVWLTDYRDRAAENASRVKLARLADNSLLVLWEVWTPDRYVATRMMRIDHAGKKLSGIIDLGSTLRLGRREDPLVVGNRVYLVSGNAPAKQLQLHVIDWKSLSNATPPGAKVALEKP